MLKKVLGFPKSITNQTAWVKRILNHPQALLILCIFSFIEASVFPIPPYVLLIPMCANNPDKAFKYALLSCFSSVAGGFLGYAIGYLAADQATTLVQDWGYAQVFEKSKAFFNQYGAYSILVSAVTPLPYKLLTITAGLFSMNLWVFLFSSIAARGLRFFFAAFVSARISKMISSKK
jgi:membrane protein YqaA with SNARE-associated domain